MDPLAEFRQKIDPLRDGCPVMATIDVIRGRWKPYLLRAMCPGPQRFSELQAAAPGITAQVLTVQLRQLEADGVITRTVFAGEMPVRVEYALTAEGERLSAAMEALEAWGIRYLARDRGRV